jgi:hypothetical protein
MKATDSGVLTLTKEQEAAQVCCWLMCGTEEVGDEAYHPRGDTMK